MSYTELPGKPAPDLNASVNWKNEAGTFGVIGQVFAEKCYVRRDSASRFAYGINSGWGIVDLSRMRGITFDPVTGRSAQTTPIPTTGRDGYPGDFGEGLGGGFWDCASTRARLT